MPFIINILSQHFLRNHQRSQPLKRQSLAFLQHERVSLLRLNLIVQHNLSPFQIEQNQAVLSVPEDDAHSLRVT